MIPHRKWVIKN